MTVFDNIFTNIWVQRVFQSLLVIIFSGIIYLVVLKYLDKREKANIKIISQKKRKTFIRMVKSIFGAAIGIVAILMILQIYGVDISSLLAGIGIASVVIGLALQDSLKDAFRGFDIVSDNYYNVGDIVKFGENTGKVIDIGFRSTKIQEIDTMNVISIANRDITQIEVISDTICIKVPLPYELPVEKAEKAFEKIISELEKNEDITKIEFRGIDELGDSAIEYMLAVHCDPTIKTKTRRQALSTIMKSLESQKISVPYQHIEIINE